MIDNYNEIYTKGYKDGVKIEISKVNELLDWLEGKTYKLSNQDSITAYETVINKISEMWGICIDEIE